MPKGREIWTDSNCVLISPQSFVINEIINYLENKYNKMYPDRVIRNMVEDEIYEIANNDYKIVYKWLKE